MSKAISQEQEAAKKRHSSSKKNQAIDFKQEKRLRQTESLPSPAEIFDNPPGISFLQPETPKMPIILSLIGCFIVAALCWFVIFQIIKPLRQAASLIAASESRIIATRKALALIKPARRLAAQKIHIPAPLVRLPEGGVTVSAQEALQVEALMDTALRNAAQMVGAGALKTKGY